MDEKSQILDWAAKCLSQNNPSTKMKIKKEYVHNLKQKIYSNMRHKLMMTNNHVNQANSRLIQQSPIFLIQKCKSTTNLYKQKIDISAFKRIEELNTRFRLAKNTLEAINPQSTLDRGYSIVTNSKNGNLITSSTQTEKGTKIKVTLAKGKIDASVTGASKEEI